MLGRAPHNHRQIRKYIAAFGTVFNELYVTRENDLGGLEQQVKVPLSYARKEKILARLAADPDINRPSATPSLPRIAFEIKDLTYNSDNKLRSAQRFEVERDTPAGIYREVLTPVPYDLHFNLYIFAKYQDDATQLVEQILPYFTPFFPMTIELIPEMNIIVDTPITLKSVVPDDTYDGEYKDRRAMVWTLSFTMTGYLFGPIRRHPLIKFANVSFYDATRFDNIGDAVGNTVAIDRVTVQPGQDANGNPTRSSALTVSYQDIEADEPWDYVVTVYGSLGLGEGTGGE